MGAVAAKATGKSTLPLGQCAALACMLEATAPKPGNVHRGADFEDLTYPDLVTSGIVIGPIIERAGEVELGEAVLRAAQATQQAVATNSNLGMILLFTPLAMVPRGTSIEHGISEVLDKLTPRDAELVYEAIRVSKPGGLGKVKEADVSGDAPRDLIAAMRLAEDRDLVARQYCNRFEQAQEVAAELGTCFELAMSLQQAIVHVHVWLMSRFPDSLIARKRGIEIAKQSAERASLVLQGGGPNDEIYQSRLADLDFWLRSDGHRRNPGTTADLVAAGIFISLRDGVIPLPLRISS